MMEESQQSRSAFLQFLKVHGEKAVLGVVVAVCAATLVLGWNGRHVGAEQVEERIKEIDWRINGQNRPAPPPPELPYPNIGVPPEVKPGPDSTPFIVTRFKIVNPPPPPPPPPVLPALLPRVGLEVAASGPYAVELTWTVTEYSRAEKMKLKNKATFPDIESLNLERAPAGTGKFKMIARGLEGDVRSFTDYAVTAKESYVYRLTPIAAKRKTLKADRILSKGAVTLPGIWALRFNGPTEGKGVYVEIEKNDRVLGPVILKKFHPLGSKLGWWARRDGDEPTSEHYIRKDGEARKVNFDTGVTLESVAQVKASIRVLQCRRIAMPDAVIHEKKTVQRPMSTFEIVLVEDGERRSIHQPPLVDRDERCKAHKGK